MATLQSPQGSTATARPVQVRVGVIGGSGYAGGELLRLLLNHPSATVTYVGSRSLAGQPVTQTHPALLGYTDLAYEPVSVLAAAEACDVLLTAVPHGASMTLAEQAVASGLRVVDIGADFRLKDAASYQQWYGLEHDQPHLLAESVYGLCEFNRSAIADARVVGNPGCYPTAALLGLLPLLEAGLVEPDGIIINALSGVSGAGSSPKPAYHFPHRTENAQAYGVATHRHTPEIESQLNAIAGVTVGPLQFTPHLVPMARGILCTSTARAAAGTTQAGVLEALHGRYDPEPFVQVLPDDDFPQTKAVAGSNQCHLTARYDSRTGHVVVVSAIDNLVKGAAGQAVQCLNLLFGLDERLGLQQAPLCP